MKRLLVLVLTLCLAGAAYATDTGNTIGPKSDNHVFQNPGTPDGREGGETIATAVPIPGLPYTDTGNTCDNINNYDEICPYSGSFSPDVVYAYTPAANASIDVDLCGSGYDTKVYVYENAVGNLVACNDDFYFGAPCGIYVSKVENVPVNAGDTYYIVIDGYGGDCGDYIMLVEGFEPCVVPCQPGCVDEGEPPLVNGYIDNYNGGCNSSPWVFQTLQATDPLDDPRCVCMCAKSGTYVAGGGGNYRDTDWFEVTAVGPTIDWTTDAEFAVNLFVILPDCNNIQIVYQSAAGPCQAATISWPAAPGEIFWLWVGPTVFSGLPEFAYLMDVCGIYGPVGTEDASWGAVKDMYR